MSLGVYLRLQGVQGPPPEPAIFIREDGRMRKISRKEWDERNPGVEPLYTPTYYAADEDMLVFHYNITHNLNTMADAAHIYEYLWQPDELGIVRAKELIKPLRKGLALLRADPVRFKKFNPPNGWGNYEGLVDFVKAYLDACTEYPEAVVSVWR